MLSIEKPHWKILSINNQETTEQMKKILQLSIVGMLIASCGGGAGDSVEAVIEGKDVEAIRAKRSALTEDLKVLEDQVQLLDSAITALDDNAKLPLVSTMTIEPQEFHHYLELQGDVMTDENVFGISRNDGYPFTRLCKRGATGF